MHGIALLQELLAALAPYGQLRVAPTSAIDDDGRLLVLLTVEPATDGDRLMLLGLADDLRYLVDMAQIRSLAATYGIDAAALEALLVARAPRVPTP